MITYDFCKEFVVYNIAIIFFCIYIAGYAYLILKVMPTVFEVIVKDVKWVKEKLTRKND